MKWKSFLAETAEVERAKLMKMLARHSFMKKDNSVCLQIDFFFYEM